MWCVKLILISCLGLVASRPQNQQAIEVRTESADPQVEIERQIIQQVLPLSDSQGLLNSHNLPPRKIADNTREILEKIAEVNKKQGLVEKKPTPNYFHFPFSYSRSQADEQRSNNFKFSKDPFSNPILEYLEKEKLNNNKNANKPNFRRPNLDNEEHAESFGLSVTDTNSEISEEDNVPGQYIKRKITHYQSFLMPNPYMFNMFNVGPSSPSLPFLPAGSYPEPNSQFASTQSANNNKFHNQQYPINPHLRDTILTSQSIGDNKNRTSLEKQTIENIKGIISENQIFPDSNFPNYNNQRPQTLGYNSDVQNINYLKQFYESLPMLTPNDVSVNNINTQALNKNIQNNKNSAEMSQQANKARQNWNWPGSNLFPIYIRDPFLQMYYAVTNMVEYGPSAGNEGPCKLTPRPQGSRIKVNSKTIPKNENRGQQVTLEMNNREGTDTIEVVEIKGSDSTDDIKYFDVEDIDIGDDDQVKFNIKLPDPSPTDGREFKTALKSEKMGWAEYIKLRNDSRLAHLASGKIDFTSETLSEPKQSSPISEQIHIDDLDDEPVESEKADDISVANQGSKKVFSKDNTGNGIFIQKLKVRKGGVAIAGPGGIATAGSGGTAIVGPNGVAYTHPNGLAIAGSGSKVVAVDPSIDLNDVIKNSVLNGTRHVPNTRLGKVVAVGPVVYYNRG